MYRFSIAILGLLMFIYHCLYYNKLDREKVVFPLYIYIAMFPYNLKNIFPYYDIFIKAILVTGIIMLFLSKRKVRFNRYEFAFLIIVTVTSIINIGSVDYNLFLKNYINLLYVIIFSFYAFNAIKTSKQMKQILNIFIVNSYVLAFCALIEYYIVVVSRPKVSLGNPNYYAIYVLVALLCAYYIYEKVTVKLILYTALVGYSMVLSGSNTIYLIIFILFVFWGISFLKVKIIYKIFGSFSICLAVFIMYTTIRYADVSNILVKYFIKNDLSRIYIWRGVWATFKNNMLIGIGYGNLLMPHGSMEYVTHNDYLRLLGEVGIFGFGVIIAYLISQYNRIIKYDHKTALHLGLFYITMVAFAMTHNNMNSILFWFFISLPMYKSCFNRKVFNEKQIESN